MPYLFFKNDLNATELNLINTTVLLMYLYVTC